MNTTTILVPLDGSKFAECALPFAIEMANKLGGAIELVCVSPQRRAGLHRRVERVAVDDENGFAARPSDYLNTTAKKIEAVSSAQVLCTVLFGTAAKELVKYSKFNDPVLFVMSTHGRGPIDRARLGSVADWVVRHASVPVLLVRPEEGADYDLTERCDFTNVLVALDGSRQAEDGLSWAEKVGGANTTYTLVRVAQNSVPVLAADTMCAPFYIDVRNFTKVGNMESVEYLRGVERMAKKEHQSVRSVVLERVPVDVGILKTAERQAADLIVITTHARGGLPRLLVGSVAERVVRGSRVPVLVVHREDAAADLFEELRHWEQYEDSHCVGAE